MERTGKRNIWINKREICTSFKVRVYRKFYMLEVCLKQFEDERNEIMVKRIEKNLTAATEEEFEVVVEEFDED